MMRVTIDAEFSKIIPPAVVDKEVVNPKTAIYMYTDKESGSKFCMTTTSSMLELSSMSKPHNTSFK